MGGPHELVHVTTRANGAEEWACGICPRRILLRWPPSFERLVLVEGDESVQHFGAKGPITMLGVDVAQEPGEDDREWLNANGIAWPA
ncbi:hypothetical protein [Planobispora longispora]|uniref:Uncharacterized protein n=1 Tax=Planobispora longispora TaxID=28887 RepID=A0A8J3RJC8_9ACTN|nr:hypothetical protein [Planobispora longispora]GIH77531.1 hypothetical protein Plo01_39600 [Planobispora longispora]